LRVLLNFRGGFPGLREGFEDLGCEVVENRWGPSDAALQGVVLCVADFVDCARELRRTASHARVLRKAGIPFIALNRDAPWHRGLHGTRLRLIAMLAPFDGYASHSMQGAQRFAKRTLYCPNAARESAYHVSPDELAAMRGGEYFRLDASFLGNLDVARYPEHRERAEFFRALDAKLQPLGLKTLFRDSGGIAADVQLDITRRSRINLSARVACDAGPEPSWGLPERCYGVPAAGGFLLSDQRRHASEDFAADEWRAYAGLDDCVAQIRELVAHPGRMREVAEHAHARVRRDHLYRHRAARLLDFARDVR
jgi:spore maturation protein CgeB